MPKLKKMAGFLTELDIGLKPSGEGIWILESPLVYYSSLLEIAIEVPIGFETDLSSVPRLPFVYWFWGARAHREGVLHDYLFRIDSEPIVSFMMANRIFLEAQKSRGKSLFVKYPMFGGVVLGGYPSYHKKYVTDKL